MNVKTRTMLIGGVLGAAVGALAGWLYYNSSEVLVDEEGVEHIDPPKPGEAVKLGLSILGLLRSLSG
jgi:hypothetical protein